MILEFEDEKGLLDAQTRALMQTCSQAAQRAEGVTLPLSVFIPSSSGLATLSVPVVAPLGQFAGVTGDAVVTAFQSACGLVNLVTPTAAVVMGALALGRIPYEKWLKFVWKPAAAFLLLTMLILVAAVIL